MQPAHVTSFIISRDPQSPRTASCTVSDVRCFMRYLLQHHIVHRDFTGMLPAVRVPRDSTIPSVWEPELVGKLLNTVDRTSPRGKRDCHLPARLSPGHAAGRYPEFDTGRSEVGQRDH